MATRTRIARRALWMAVGMPVLAFLSSQTTLHRPADIPSASVPSQRPVIESVEQLEWKLFNIGEFTAPITKGRETRRRPRHEPARQSFPARTLDAGPPSANSQGTAITTPFPSIGFPGTDDTGLFPASPDIAAGPDHLVQVVNETMSMFDKCGNPLASLEFSSVANSLFGDSTSTFFDPRIVYDEFDDGFAVVVSAVDLPNQTAYLMVMTTADSSAFSTWWVTQLQLTNLWATSPDIGAGPTGIYIPYDAWNFSPSTFDGARIALTYKVSTGVSLVTTFANLANAEDGSPAQTIRTAAMHSWEGKYWLASTKPGGGSGITLWEIAGVPVFPTIMSHLIPVTAYSPPPDCIQPDGQLVDTGDARLGNLIYESNELWTVHSRLNATGPPGGLAALDVYGIDTSTLTLTAWYSVQPVDSGNGNLYAAYPSIDFDIAGRGVVCFLGGGPTRYMSVDHSGISKYTGFAPSYRITKPGEEDYSTTGSPPWMWGRSSAVARDPVDDKTLWLSGVYASSAPTPSWDTHVAAIQHTGLFEFNLIDVTPSAPVVSVGPEGGPFTPPEAAYVVNNFGQIATGWRVYGYDSWEYPDLTSGFLAPGETDTVRMAFNANAAALTDGVYTDNYTFENCFTGATFPRSTELTVVGDGTCPGAVLDLLPSGTSSTATAGNQLRGVYITAMKDIDVCALGMAIDLQMPQTVTAWIREADGTTPGAVIASATKTLLQSGDVMHYVPITASFSACRDYEISFQFGAANSWQMWDESTIIEPYDVGGAIRVRDGSLNDGAGNTALGHFALLGTATSCDQTSDLTAPGGSWGSCTDPQTERGLYVTATKTLTVCALRWYADFGGVPAELAAKIYEATGTTRGALIATGTATDSSAAGMSAHTIAINCQLREGMEYDIVVEFPAAWWACMGEGSITLPYTIDDAITVRDGEQGGNANNSILTHFVVDWSPGPAGLPFDFVKPDVYPPPNVINQPDLDYGIYVTALAGEELYSLGWKADIPDGAVIGARVYNASGTSRGTLLSEGTIVSSGPGMKWHDVPVSATLVSGSDYDFEIDITQVNEWRWWWDLSGLPYEPYGTIRIVDGEQGGNAANGALIEMRMNACNDVATAIPDSDPVRPPKLSMSFHPNPASASATLSFTLDEAGPVTITVYDVAGRRVTTLLRGDRRPVGPGAVRFDTGIVAAGVYFVKLQTSTRSISRKITVVR